MKHFFIMILFLIYFQKVYSLVSLKGDVLDENNNAIIGCWVRVLSTDSTYVSGGLTNEMGTFNIEGLRLNNCILHLSYIGYEDKYITCANVLKNVDMGSVTLTPLSKVLSEVQVIGSNKINPTNMNLSWCTCRI